MDPETAKQILRAQALASRGAVDSNAAARVAKLILTRLVLPKSIAAVWPLPGELDLQPLIHALHERGHEVLLPQTPAKAAPLRFRRWSPSCEMIRERFGTYYPDGEESEPELILVPLLAFDRFGHRLGYGGGYYDRTLAARPSVLRVGYAHVSQEISCVPAAEHDIAMPMIVTDQRILSLRDVLSPQVKASASGRGEALF